MTYTGAMKIVVLDVTPPKTGSSQLGELEVFDRTTKEQIVARLQGAAIALTNKAVPDRAVISALPDLRFIGVTATGYNVADIAAAREWGPILVCNVPEYGTRTSRRRCSPCCWQCTNRTGHHAETVRAGNSSGHKGFRYGITRWWGCPDSSWASLALAALAAPWRASGRRSG